MLYEFTCTNFKSIKNTVKFSMLATSDDRYENTLYQNGKNRFLRVASIYGANGSGKSTFINALSFVKYLVCKSSAFQPGMKLPSIHHRLNPEGKSIFTTQFEKNGVRYAFGFSMKEGKMIDEYLYYFPNNQKTKIFERTERKIISGNKFRTTFTLAKKAIKDERLFLSLAANFSDSKEVEDAFAFFRDDLVFYAPANNWGLYSYDQYQKNEKTYKRAIELLKSLDTGIISFSPSLEEHPLDPRQLPFDLLKEMDDTEEYKEIEMKATIDYGVFKVELEEESAGIQKLISIIGPILDIIDKNKVLIFDEIESGLHEFIVREIIKIFRNQTGNHNPQLIFTTHDTSLLDADLFRRDQIWFTELERAERFTDLYSLAELKNVRKVENFKNGYIMGKYNAIPMLHPVFEQVFDYTLNSTTEDV